MIRDIFKRTRDHVVAGGMLVWHKLPRIAIYSLALYVLFFVGSGVSQAIDKSNIEKTAATDFLNYTSFTVQNAREGEDVTFTLCRTHKENYDIDGTRTVYVIPEGKTAADKVFVYSRRVDEVVDTGNCQSYYIKSSEYHFTQGKYLITLNINFKVKYDIRKSVYTESGVFTIYPLPVESDDVNAQLNILKQQLQDQQEIIDRLIANGSVRTPTTSGNGTAPVPTPTPTPQSPGNSGNNNGNGSPAPPPKVEYREVCDPLIDLLGIRLGETNCRQEQV